MKKNITFLMTMLFSASALFAQDAWEQSKADVTKSDVTITLDGDASDWPTGISKNAIERDYTDETPAFTTEPTWAALWNETDLYILIEYTDDDWVPVFDPAWQADKTEVAIDVNATLADGGGASAQADGHYQVAPGYDEENQGVEGTNGIGFYADTYDDEGKVVREIRIPFSSAIDVDGNAFTPAIDVVIGFDITIADNDNEGRNRRVWSNFGEVDQNWANMDQAGAITLKLGNATSVFDSKANTLNVYPNPTAGNISVDGTFQTIELYDIAGKLVKTFNNVSNSINIEDVDNGMYMLNFDGKSKATILKN